jgi:hypothetical protein
MIWKYALALELTDTGFDYSVLSEFRARLVQGGQEAQLLEALLTLFKEKGWLKARGCSGRIRPTCWPPFTFSIGWNWWGKPCERR